MRLDLRESALKARPDGTPVVPGKSADSLLYQRISDTDATFRMPPPDSRKQLTAAQIALLKGLRVIGSAGSPEKFDWLQSLDVEAFDYRQTPAKEALAEGIDVYFDNVGGTQLEAALSALRPFGRVIACGSILQNFQHTD